MAPCLVKEQYMTILSLLQSHFLSSRKMEYIEMNEMYLSRCFWNEMQPLDFVDFGAAYVACIFQYGAGDKQHKFNILYYILSSTKH